METLWKDFRFSIRMLFKNPGFTTLAVVVLALAISTNSAIFILVNALLLRPLGFEEPDQVVGCYSKSTKPPGSYRAFSYPNYRDLREQNTVFTSLMAHDVTLVGLTEGDTTRRTFADIVSSNYFSTFGVRLAKGRAFTPAEEEPGSAVPVAVVSWQYWKRTGSDPDLVGKTLRINGRTFTIVGIAPEDFTGTSALISFDLWLPLGIYDKVKDDMFRDRTSRLSDRSNHHLILAGRLRPGLTPEKANPELTVVAAQLEKAFPAENKDQTLVAYPLPCLSITTNPQSNRELVTVSVLLMAMAGIVLLIACLNLANMLLARGTARRKEFAIRLALGGSRARILRQILVEGLVLSFVAGAASLVLASWASNLVVRSTRELLPFNIVFRLAPDIRVLAAMLGFCVLSTLLFSLGPAWKLSGSDVLVDLKEQAGADLGGPRRRGLFSRRNVLVMAQMALSLALVVAAGLFIRSAIKAVRADPGFSLDHGLLAEVDPGLAGYDEVRGREIYRSLLERLRTLPGIEAVSIAATVPFGNVRSGRRVQRAGEEVGDGSIDAQAAPNRVSCGYNVIGEDYFKALAMPLLRGRPFTTAEGQLDAPHRVAIIDELLARRLWPNEDPLGKYIEFSSRDGGRKPEPMEVVGVVPTIKEDLFQGAPEPFVYVPFGQHYQSGMNVHLRLSAQGVLAIPSLLGTVRRQMRQIDERLPILSLNTLRGHINQGASVWLVRTGAEMFSVFGGLALVLAIVGVYGVKAYTVARRTREIGIRMALGATARDTLWLVLVEGIRLTLVGVCLGLLLAFAIGRVLRSMLYEVSSADPLIFSVAPLLLAGASLAACYFPARRAARVDPIKALKYE